MLRVIFSPSRMDTRRVTRKWLDLPYADGSPSQKLDIYLPEEGKGPFPVVLSIHAGAWMFGDKLDVSNRSMLEGLKRGFALVCIDYRLSGEAKFPGQIQDCKAAVRFLRANAVAYQLDGSRIIACGGSAGGHLAALLGTSAGAGDLEDLSMGNAEFPAHVQGVVCWSAPLEDFLKIDQELKENGAAKADHNEEYSPESKLFGSGIQNVPEQVRAASPMTYLHAEVPPFFILHGAADNEVPARQSLRFCEELIQVAGREKATLEIIQGAGHNDKNFETREVVDRMFGFIEGLRGE